MCWDKCPLQLHGRKHVLNLHNSNLPSFQANKASLKGFSIAADGVNAAPPSLWQCCCSSSQLIQDRQHLCPSHPGTVGRRHPQRSLPWAFLSTQHQARGGQETAQRNQYVYMLRTMACLWPVTHRSMGSPAGMPRAWAPPVSPQPRLLPQHNTSANSALKSSALPTVLWRAAAAPLVLTAAPPWASSGHHSGHAASFLAILTRIIAGAQLPSALCPEPPTPSLYTILSID